MIIKCCDECLGDQRCDNLKWCCCGSAMEDHDIGSGHSPVSMHDHTVYQLNNPEPEKTT